MNDRDKLNAINRLIQLEQEEVQALYKPQSDLRAKLSESQYHFELACKQISDFRKELDNTQDILIRNNKKL